MGFEKKCLVQDIKPPSSSLFMPHCCSSPPVSRSSKHSRPDPIPVAHSGRSRSDLFGIIGLSCNMAPQPPYGHRYTKKIKSVKSHQIPAACQACTTLFFLQFFASNILGHILWTCWDIYLGDRHGLLNIQHRIFCSRSRCGS